MATLEELKEKMKNSNISTPPFPDGGFSYNGVCVVPNNKRFFTSTDEVDEYMQKLLELEFAN